MVPRLRLLIRSHGHAALLLAAAVLAAAALSAAAGCGSSDDAGSGGDAGSAAAATTPEEIGAQVTAIYTETMTEVVELMEPRPDAATLTPELEKLKEQTIEQLVALGKQREALDADGRAASDAVVRDGLSSLSPELYAQYQEGQSYYLSQDTELGNLIASFNIITQYADYDLLRSQEPDEAERLGL
jgi:glutamate 5-kinase